MGRLTRVAILDIIQTAISIMRWDTLAWSPGVAAAYARESTSDPTSESLEIKCDTLPLSPVESVPEPEDRLDRAGAIPEKGCTDEFVKEVARERLGLE